VLSALMLDLGETLVHEGVVLPHVHESLSILKTFTSGDQTPLALALVSDFGEPGEGNEGERFEQYVETVGKLDLLRYFEPPERHITLSFQAGARKPDRRVFELALTRLGAEADLTTAGFITENSQHVAAASSLGMKTLRFGAMGDFEDWAEAPLRVASWLALPPTALLPALNLALEHEFGLLLSNLREDQGAKAGRLMRGLVTQTLESTAAPIELEVGVTAEGTLGALRVPDVALDDSEASRQFLETLRANKQVVTGGEGRAPLPPGATHEVVTGPDGRPLLTRKRFSLT
jgi:hypothetical protein